MSYRLQNINNLTSEYLSDLFHVYKLFYKNLRSENGHLITNTEHHTQKTISHKMSVI